MLFEAEETKSGKESPVILQLSDAMSAYNHIVRFHAKA